MEIDDISSGWGRRLIALTGDGTRWFWRQKRPTPECASLSYLIIAESGRLEHQALLLVESIRRFAGYHATHPIAIISPRPSRRPARATIAALENLGCSYHALDLASIEPDYGPSFRLYVAAFMEAQATTDRLAMLDSDLFFAAPPDFNLMGHQAAARPVDVKGICTLGSDDPFEGYWRALCKVANVSYDAIPMIETTANTVRVKASYNGGLVIAERSAGIFRATLDLFEASTMQGLTPVPGSTAQIGAGAGPVAQRGAELWGSSQSCLSVSIWGRGHRARVLPPSHNMPMHIHGLWSDRLRALDPVILHYHRLFYDDDAANPIINGSVRLPADFLDWLRSRCHLFREASTSG